jgi:hypothetical protein
MTLALQPEINEHYRRQKLTLPSRATLYRYRISLDLCSMLYCRQTLLAATGVFCLHVRLDASPQFGKDYLNGEADVIRIPADAVSPAVDSVHAPQLVAANIKSRMLVGQVMGARATTTVHKTLKLAHMLQLESESLSATLCFDRSC